LPNLFLSLSLWLNNQTIGFVAQLYRAPHYGCGGLRLESLRGHKKNPARKCWVFPFKAIKVYFKKQFKRKNPTTAEQLGFYAWVSPKRNGSWNNP